MAEDILGPGSGASVDVNSLPALPAGNNNIGDVDVVTLPALPAGNNNIGDVDIVTLPALPAGTNVIGHVVVDSASSVAVTSLPALATGSNVVGAVTQSGTWTVQPGNTANTTPWLVSLRGAAGAGNSIYRNINLAATGQNVKNTQGSLYGWYLFNNATAVRYVKLYDKATAPTVGTDTPVMTIPLPAGAAANVSFPNGLGFTNGIGIGATTAVADNDTGAPGSNEVIVNLSYV